MLPLNIEELQVEGYAFVNAVKPSPRIAAGEGSAVTGRFVTRQVDVIARIEVLGADGQVETIEGTTIHPIWSLDRNDWVPLGELVESEQLLGASGAAVVLTVAILQRSTPVYNIEVHGEHVYQVGWLGVLVHNACVLGNNASGARAILSGRLKGFMRVNTDLPGGTSAARSMFQNLVGVYPTGPTARGVLPNGMEVLFREASKTGSSISKIEVIDPLLRMLEKITFR